MEKQLRYKGEFLSRAGVVWRVEILQDADAPFAEVGDLTMEADEALTIEWEGKDKEEVVCGSTATLRIESPGDRTYIDLYTIEPGAIRMDVYRDGDLYWSGTLDPEFYEEPYERLDKYTVSLTFSDFGILDRLKYERAGMVTLESIIREAVARSCINTTGIDTAYISSAVPSDDGALLPLTLDMLRVRSDNFYDEDGEASTMEEVVEGILQPLALRMVQRAGKVYIYDLNALYADAPVRMVQWDGDSQTLGTDKVYNNAIITWSPYAKVKDLLPDECWTITTDDTLTNLDNLEPVVVDNARVWTWHNTQDEEQWKKDPTDAGFSVWLSREGKNLELLHDYASFFKMVPHFDGQECEGVALMLPPAKLFDIEKRGTMFDFIEWWIRSQQPTYTRVGFDRHYLAGALTSKGQPIFRTQRVTLPPAPDKSLLLRLKIEMLMDPRFNPFEQAVNWDYTIVYKPTGVEESGRMKRQMEQFDARGNFVYVPVRVLFRPDDGSGDTYIWNNALICSDSVSRPIRRLPLTYGSWIKVPNGADMADYDGGYICYYDPDDRKEKCGVTGWQANRPAINPHSGRIDTALAKCEDGQYITYPVMGNAGGSLTVEVLTGRWMIKDCDHDYDKDEIPNPYGSDKLLDKSPGLWEMCKWILLKTPQLDIVNYNYLSPEIDDEDVEYKAEIHPHAKEDVTIDTICGTSKKSLPTARGAYFMQSGAQLKELTRAARTSQVEDLLIGTLFSQYGTRHTTLSGESVINAHGLCAYTEANQGDTKFILVEDMQDVITDVSDAVYVELSPDEYKKDGEE